jgi:phosphoserine phosphatase RsbU/P
MKILIAEDDWTSRTVLQGILSKWDYEVVATSDGEAAFTAMQTPDAPQLAVIDWMMPKMDGPTLCRKLRAQERTEPVYLILLTSRGESRDIVEGLEAGADDFIAKPYDNRELHARINVGKRLISLQNELQEREKLKGVLEMAGAVCHELNQPLQSVSGYCELLLMDLSEKDPNYQKLTHIASGVSRIGQLTQKMMNISRYQSKPYLNRGRIVDIEGATQNNRGK